MKTIQIHTETAVKWPDSLLSIDTNAKTVKGQALGFMTGILYLAPADMAGPNICPMADAAGCKAACLYSAGRGQMSSVQKARINRTRLYHAYRAEFLTRLAADISRLVKKATKAGFTPLVRLNGTSDIRWESEPVTIDGVKYPNLMSAFPGVQFFDYTKIPNRRDVPANYDLTFSYSGFPGFDRYVEKARAAGMRVAAVWRRRADIPAVFKGWAVVDGDNSDVRHIDPKGVFVGLYAKGAAVRDTSGFVLG